MQVIFIDASGNTTELEADKGCTLMQVAVDNGIEGIVAECGGACSCATCHCYVGEEWLGKLNSPSMMEDEMLDCVNDRRQNSRLSCQISLDENLDGIRVTVPESQY